MLYNICPTCWNRSDQWPVKNPLNFHGGIRFQSSFTIRWELENKNFLKIDIICLDDSLKYRIMAIKTNENFTPFSNSVTFRKPRGTDLDSLRHQIPAPCPHSPPNGIYIDRCIKHFLGLLQVAISWNPSLIAKMITAYISLASSRLREISFSIEIIGCLLSR